MGKSPEYRIHVSDESIPDRVKVFVTEQIDSVVQLEILLLLYRQSGQDFTAGDVASQLRIDPAWAAPQLDVLCARSVLVCAPGPPAVYRYGPRTPELHETIAQLAQSYATHRVRITTMIFSKPPDALRSFADAFRLRKEKPDG